MSDYNSSNPVRTEADGSDERLHVKIVDGTNPAVHQVSVDSDKNLHTEVHTNDPAGVDRVLRTSELGALTPDGVYDATNNTKPGNTGVIASQRSASPGDTTQNMRLTAVAGASNVTAMDVSLHDQSGNPYTESNPLPVSLEESPGTEVHSFINSTAVAAGSSANADYSITAGKTLKLKKVSCSASGKARFELQVSPDGTTFTSKAVFFNSTANPNVFWDIFSMPITDSGTGAKIRVICANEDLQPQNIYVTISGIEE